MKNVRILLIILLAAAFAGCQKDDAGKTVATQEVSFGIELIDLDGLKSGIVECQTDIQGNMLMPGVVEIEITNQDINVTSTFTPQVFMLDDKLYTQAIKLSPGNYTISKFLLLTEVGGTIVMAIPEANSEFGQYVTNGLEYSFAVSAFSKFEISLQVLCFEPARYDEFGFTWFHLNEIVVRQHCFFGDLCVKDPQDYAGSFYANQVTGLQIDMPAIFKIIVKKDGVETPYSPFTNATAEAGWGVGAPVCVQYPDNLSANEVFTFDLWILVRVGSTFQFKYFHTWTLEDDERLDDGDDGIVDFVMGNCNFSYADLTLAPYQNLPASASIDITRPGDPGYVNIVVNSINPPGSYDLPLGEMAGWSGDIGDASAPDGTSTRNIYVYSSFYTTNWPAGITFTPQDIAKVNWLFNNLANFAGFSAPGGNTITSADITQEQGVVIQHAIWEIIHGSTGASGMALEMADAAAGKGDFVPLPGGWAAILCVAINKPVQHQLIFTVVDP